MQTVLTGWISGARAVEELLLHHRRGGVYSVPAVGTAGTNGIHLFRRLHGRLARVMCTGQLRGARLPNGYGTRDITTDPPKVSSSSLNNICRNQGHIVPFTGLRSL